MAATSAVTIATPSFAASQRARVLPCVHANTDVPFSSSSTNGAASATPIRPGRRLNQPSPPRRGPALSPKAPTAVMQARVCLPAQPATP